MPRSATSGRVDRWGTRPRTGCTKASERVEDSGTHFTFNINMPNLVSKRKAGAEGITSSGLGHLAGLTNNTDPKWWRDPCLRKLHFSELIAA